MKTFDYIFIGSGPSTYRATNILRGGNKNVLVVENDLFGGTCPNYGCEPKIFLDGAVESVYRAKYLQNKGLYKTPKINWSELIQRKKKIFGLYPKNAEDMMTDKNITTIHGTGKIVSNNIVSVDGEKIFGKNIVIATGQVNNKLNIPGKEFTVTSEYIFNMGSLPQRITIIGAGYVGLELATLLNAAGSDVTVVEYSDKALSPFDQDLVATLIKIMETNGIKFRFNEQVIKVTKSDNGSSYITHTKFGTMIDAELVLDASGRIPNVNNLNLDNAGIEYDKRKGIIVNEYMRTNLSNVYAIGDVVNKNQPKLTTVSWFEASYLIDHLEGKNKNKISYPYIATTAFTFPQISQVGIKASEKKDSDIVKEYDLSNNFDSLGLGDSNAKLKVIFDKHMNVIGASEISYSASDDINHFLNMMSIPNYKDYIEKKVIYAFPTLASKLDALVWEGR